MRIAAENVPASIAACLAAVTLCMIWLNPQALSADRLAIAVASPADCQMQELEPNSFSAFVASLPLKAGSVRAQRYDGKPAFECCNDYRVVDLDFLFDSDLEQCADMGYRLFAEYCYNTAQPALVDFKLQNGQRLSWPEWCAGKRLRYDPRADRHVLHQTVPDSSRAAFEDYLYFLFWWSGSWAVLKYTEPIDPDSLRPGDMIVQNQTGGMGHLSIIFGVCTNDSGEQLYLIGSGWTPAQEILIHKPAAGEGDGHWFTLAGYEHHLAAFAFGPLNFRRFADAATPE